MKRLSAELQSRIKDIIDRMLVDYDLDSITIKTGESHDGTESIFVDIWHRLNEREYDSNISVSLVAAVHDMLMDHDELRFPYIRHHLPEHQKVKGW